MASHVSNTDYLVEIDFRIYDIEEETVSTTYLRYSRYVQRTYDSNIYEPRISDLGEITQPYIDASQAEFSGCSVTIRNWGEDFSDNFLFQQLRSQGPLRLQRMRIYRYDATADTVELLWHGYTKTVTWQPEELTVTVEGSYVWDTPRAKIPMVLMGHRCPYNFPLDPLETEIGDTSGGCKYDGVTYGVAPTTGSSTSCDHTWDGTNGCRDKGMLKYFGGFIRLAPVLNDAKNNWIDREKVRESPVPRIYGTGGFKIKPEITHARIKDTILMVNFVVSSCHRGQPFAEEDFGNIRIGGAQRARFVKYYLGVDDQDIPANKTKFPDGLGHSLIAHGYAEFELTKAQVDKYASDVPFHLVTLRMENGAKTKSGAHTNNHVHVLRDMLQDPIFGLGIPDSDLDISAINAAAAANPFTGRFEIDKQIPYFDWVQNMLRSFHGYITFNDGKMQIGKKTNAESAVAIFGTGGYRIIDFQEVKLEEKNVEDLINQFNVKYRDKFRNGKRFQWNDSLAQKAAGDGIRVPNSKDIFLEGIYDDYQAAVSVATFAREELNLTFFGSFETSEYDFQASGIKPGDIIRVNSPHIPNNDNIYLFRVGAVRIAPEEHRVTVPIRLYIPAVYDFDTDTLGDVISGPSDPTIPVYPPVVENLTAVGTKVKDDDDDSFMENIHVTWDNPTNDPADEAELDEEMVHYDKEPIEEVLIKWNYEDLEDFRLIDAISVKYPQNSCDFQIPWHPNRLVRVWAVSKARNHGTGEIGYVKNPDKTAALDTSINATQTSFDVDDATAMGVAVDDYIKIGTEYLKVSNVTGDTITVYDDGGNRVGYFNSDPVTHEEGDEVAVAEPSHPTDIVDLSTRRYTLPQVQNVTIKEKPNHIRLKCQDIDQAHHERYIFYIGFDEAILGVGGTLETAYGGVGFDPLNPGITGVHVEVSRDNRMHLTDNELDTLYGADATGVEVLCRVVAKRRMNFSSELSDPANANTGHHNKPLNAPANPVSGDIRFESVPNTNKVKTFIKVWVNAAKDVSFDDGRVTLIGAVLQKYNKNTAAYETERQKTTEDVEDGTALAEEVVFELHRGAKFRLVGVFTKNPGMGNRRSNPGFNSSMIEFTVGSQVDTPSVITDLTIAAFGSNEATESVERDPKTSDLLITFTQPSPPGALQYVQIQKKKSASTKWTRAVMESLVDDEEDADLQTAGAKVLRHEVSHPKNQAMDYRARLVFSDGSKTSWATRSNTSSTEGGVSPITQAPSFPFAGHIITNEPVGDISDGKALVVLTPYASGDGSAFWDTSNVETVTCLVDENTANTERTVSVSVANLHQNQIPVAFELQLGHSYVWRWNQSSNALPDRERSEGGVTFVAGSDVYGFDAATSIVTTSIVVTAEDPKHSQITVNYTQPATPVLLKKVLLQAKRTAASNWEDIYTWDAGNEPSVFSTTGAKSFVRSVKHRKNTAYTYRFLLIPFGSNRNSATTKTVTSSSTTSQDETGIDSVAPSTPTGATIKYNRKGTRLRCDRPDGTTDGQRNIVSYEWQVRTASLIGGSHYYMDADGSMTTASTNTILSTSNVHTLPLKRREIGANLSAANQAAVIAAGLVVAVRATNNIGTSSYSSFSTATSALERDAYNDDDGINPKRLARSSVGFMEGGSCAHGRSGPGQYATSGLSTQVGLQWRVDKAGATLGRDRISNPNNLISTTALLGAQWEQANHRLALTVSGTGIAGKIGKLASSGKWYTPVLLIGASVGTLTLTALTVQLLEVVDAPSAPWDGGSITSIVGASVTLDTSYALPNLSSAGYLFLGGPFKVNSGYTQGNGKMWLLIRPTWTGTGTVYLDDIQLFPGRDVRPWSPGPIEAGLDSIVNLNAVAAHATTFSDEYGSLNDGLGTGLISKFVF